LQVIGSTSNEFMILVHPWVWFWRIDDEENGGLDYEGRDTALIRKREGKTKICMQQDLGREEIKAHDYWEEERFL
jgi:hypothetical protein